MNMECTKNRHNGSSSSSSNTEDDNNGIFNMHTPRLHAADTLVHNICMQENCCRKNERSMKICTRHTWCRIQCNENLSSHQKKTKLRYTNHLPNVNCYSTKVTASTAAGMAAMAATTTIIILSGV